MVAGDKNAIGGLDEVDDAWQVGPDVPAADVMDRYRHETALANATVTTLPADPALAWRPHHLFGEPHLHSLRDVLPHVITETACHAGHLDATRELIDGRQWMVLT